MELPGVWDDEGFVAAVNVNVVIEEDVDVDAPRAEPNLSSSDKTRPHKSWRDGELDVPLPSCGRASVPRSSLW